MAPAARPAHPSRVVRCTRKCFARHLNKSIRYLGPCPKSPIFAVAVLRIAPRCVPASRAPRVVARAALEAGFQPDPASSHPAIQSVNPAHPAAGCLGRGWIQPPSPRLGYVHGDWIQPRGEAGWQGAGFGRNAERLLGSPPRRRRNAPWPFGGASIVLCPRLCHYKHFTSHHAARHFTLNHTRYRSCSDGLHETTQSRTYEYPLVRPRRPPD